MSCQKPLNQLTRSKLNKKAASGVSIIIPVRNEEQYIGNCLNSILNSDYDIDMLEIIIIDGLCTDETIEIAITYRDKFKHYKIITNDKIIAPVAFNLGIKNSSYDYIMILCAHSTIDSDYIKKLVHYSEELNADLVGGTAKIRVKHNNKKTVAITRVVSSPLGAGTAKTRVGVKAPTKADAASGIYRKSIFSKVGLFNEMLIRNQDIEHSKRIINAGGSIYVVPDVFYFGYERETFTELAKKNFRNGLWVILTTYYTKNFKSLSTRHFIPLFFIISLCVPTFLSLFWMPFLYLSLFSLLSHFILVCLTSVKLNNSETNLANLMSAFYTLHFSYGLGSLLGVIKVVRYKFFNKKSILSK